VEGLARGRASWAAGQIGEWAHPVSVCPQRIGERTSVAMQAAKRQGRHMGRVSMLPQATSGRLLTLRASYTLAGTAVQLNAEGLTTATGGTWTANSVGKARARLLTA